MYRLANGADSKEGVDSFLEKRDAKFTQTVKEMPAFFPVSLHSVLVIMSFSTCGFKCLKT